MSTHCHSAASSERSHHIQHPPRVPVRSAPVLVGTVNYDSCLAPNQTSKLNDQPAPVPELMPQLLTAMGCWGRGHFALPPSCCCERLSQGQSGQQCLPAPPITITRNGRLCSKETDATDAICDAANIYQRCSNNCETWPVGLSIAEMNLVTCCRVGLGVADVCGALCSLGKVVSCFVLVVCRVMV